MIVTRRRLLEWVITGVEPDLDRLAGAIVAKLQGLGLDPDEAVEILVSEDDAEGLHGTEVERVADGSYRARGYLECYAEGETWEQAIGALRQVARDCRERDTVQGRLNRQRESVQALRVAHNQLATVVMRPEPACVSCRWERVADAGLRACDLPMLADVYVADTDVGTLLGKLLLAQAASPGGCPCHEPAAARIREEEGPKKSSFRGSADLTSAEWPAWIRSGAWECPCGKPEAVTVDVVPGNERDLSWVIRCVCGAASVVGSK